MLVFSTTLGAPHIAFHYTEYLFMTNKTKVQVKDILGYRKGRRSVTHCQPSWHPSWDRQAKPSLHNTKHLLAFFDCLLVLYSRSRGSNAGQSSPATTSGTTSVSTGPYLLPCWNPEIPQCVSSNLISIFQRQDGVFFSVSVGPKSL